jgi:dephospho-CoA kinase
MERVMKRDNRTKEDVERIIAKQLSEKERELKSDFTIVNYNCKILDQILAVHHQICAKSM